MIRFRAADFDTDIKINDEDIQKYYDAHKAELKTDEKRKVEFVQLTLTEEEKKLTGKERIEALQKLADRATDFTQALLEKGADFKQAAATSQLPVHETGEFTAAEPDPQLKVDPKLGAAAFKLSVAGAEQRSGPGCGWILYFASHRQDRDAAAHAGTSKTENCGRAEEDACARVGVNQRRGVGATAPRSQEFWSTA